MCDSIPCVWHLQFDYVYFFLQTYCLFSFTYTLLTICLVFLFATSLFFTISSSSSFPFMNAIALVFTNVNVDDNNFFSFPNLSYHSQQMESSIVHNNIFGVEFSFYLRLKIRNWSKNAILLLLTSSHTHTVLLKLFLRQMSSGKSIFFLTTNTNLRQTNTYTQNSIYSMWLSFLSTKKKQFCPLFRLCVTNQRSEHQKEKKFYLDYDVIFSSHNCHVNAYTSKQ